MTKDQFKNLLRSDVFHTSLKINKHYVNNLFKNHGVLCLSSCSSSIPMWGYYGDEHKGYSLIFELDYSYIQKNLFDLSSQEKLKNGDSIISFRGEDGFRFAFVKIKYQQLIPKLFLDEIHNLKKNNPNNQYLITECIVKNSVGVKFEEWQHENEYRLIVNGNSFNSEVFDLRAYILFLKIKGVIMGAKLEQEDKIYGLCQEYKIDLYKASCSDAKYKMCFQKVFDAKQNTHKLTTFCKCGCNLSILLIQKRQI